VAGLGWLQLSLIHLSFFVKKVVSLHGFLKPLGPDSYAIDSVAASAFHLTLHAFVRPQTLQEFNQ
jgi:hypothetical protein